MDLLYIDNNLVYNELKWPLEYIIFGSKSSIDYDVIINIPIKLTELNYHNFLIMNEKIDKILYSILCKEFDMCYNIIKPINSCLGHWSNNNNNNNNTLLWSQKGTIAETNNAIIKTFDNYKNQQMYVECPIKNLVIRDNKNKQSKLMAASRMIIGIFTNVETDDNYIYEIMNKIISIPELFLLNKNDKNRFMSTLFKIYNISTSNYKIISSKINIDIEYNKLLTLRNKLNIMLKTNINIENYKKLYKESEEAINNITNVINNTKQLFDADFLILLNENIIGSKLSLRCIVRSVLNIKYACFKSEFIKKLDMNKITICNEKYDKLKKISFQLGQSLLLYRDIEVFEKETIALYYPDLEPILFRKSIDNYDYLNNLLYEFANLIDCHLERTQTE